MSWGESRRWGRGGSENWQNSDCEDKGKQQVSFKFSSFLTKLPNSCNIHLRKYTHIYIYIYAYKWGSRDSTSLYRLEIQNKVMSVNIHVDITLKLQLMNHRMSFLFLVSFLDTLWTPNPNVAVTVPTLTKSGLSTKLVLLLPLSP